MITPWYKHKFFEVRVNSSYDEVQDQELFFVEYRISSYIPFKKWTSWGYFKLRPFSKFRTLDKCLDELNVIKEYLIHIDIRKKKSNDYKNSLHWKEIYLK